MVCELVRSGGICQYKMVCAIFRVYRTELWTSQFNKLEQMYCVEFINIVFHGYEKHVFITVITRGSLDLKSLEDIFMTRTWRKKNSPSVPGEVYD